MKPRLALSLAISATLALAPLARAAMESAQSVTASEPGKPLTAPIELTLSPYAGLLRTITGRIGDLEGPFLFDTGGGATILSSESVKTLGLTPFGRVTGFRHDGSRIDAPRSGPFALHLGAFVRHAEAGVLDLGSLLGNLPPVVGIVSLETFEDQAITIDLARNRLTVETPSSLARRIQGARELRIRFERQAGGATLDVNVAIEGKHGPLWFELDCGSLGPVLIAPHAFEELGLEVPAAGTTARVKLPVVGLGSVAGEIAAKEMIYDGLLNAEFFTRFVITLDLAHGRAWARPNPDPS